MSGEFGGTSPLGQSLNKIASKADGTTVQQQKTVRGTIIEVKDGEYIIRARIQKSASSGTQIKDTKWIAIENPISMLSQTQGSPETLIEEGMSVDITYSGTDVNRGKAKLVEGTRNKNKVIASNQLNIQGAAFAPPGSGFM